MSEGGVNFSDIHNSSIQAHTIVGGNLTVIHNLVKGPDRLPTDYGTRIQNFLREYLGDETSPVPFGGRDAEIAMLNAWLADPAAPRCLFMSAEAGRGKSALLVRWCAILQQFSDIKVVFVPISIRFETSAREVFYTALAARLAAVHGETVQYAQLSADQWKGVCDQYLQKMAREGQQVIVVIDGLDEATGWQPGASFIPLPLPAGIRVVASARVQTGKEDVDWLRQLGWQAGVTARMMSLYPLDMAGVEAVLVGMGNPLETLATRVDVVSKLLELSEGDPLLIRLYVDALLGSAENPAFIEPNDLAGMEAKGLKGYFKGWWEDQEKQWLAARRNPLETQMQTEAFLNAVASAFGPLGKEDVLAVTEQEGLTGYRLAVIAKEVGRFVIGDGEERGYTFSHPRLGYYFFAQLGKREQRAWNDRYISYGTRTLQDLHNQKRTTWVDSEVQPYTYVVQHYRTHLDRGQAAREAYYALICHEWAQAWEALRGTYDGFLEDVMGVWVQAQNDPDKVRGMTMAVLCALGQSSIVALSSNIPPALLARATRSGALSKAQVLVLLQQNSSDERKAAIIEALGDLLESDRQQEFRDHLLKVARTMQDSNSRARALNALVPHMPDRMSIYREILNAICTMKHEENRASILSALAPQIPLEVLEAIDDLRETNNRVSVLVAVAPHLPQKVWEIAHTIADEDDRTSVLSALVPHLPKNISVYRKVLVATHTIGDEKSRANVLSVLAPYLPEGVFKLTSTIRDEKSRANVLSVLAPYLPEGVFKLTSTIGDEESRANVLSALVPYIPEEVFKVIFTIKNTYNHANVLSTLAPHLPNQVLGVAREMEDDAYRAFVLSALAPHLPWEVWKEVSMMGKNKRSEMVIIALAPYLPHKVWDVMHVIEDEESRASLLRVLAPHLPQEVLEVTHSIEDEGRRASVLSMLAPLLPQKVLEVTHKLEGEEYRASVLSTLAPQLPQEVLEVTDRLEDEKSRASLVSVLALYLPNRAPSYRKALEATRAIGDDNSRACLLIKLARYLPDSRSIYQKVLEIIHTTKNDRDSRQVNALSALAPHLSNDVWEIARTMKHEDNRAIVLQALAPYMPQKVLEATRTIKHFVLGRYINLLIALAPHLPLEVLEAVRRMRHKVPWWRERVFKALAPYLPNEVLEVIQSIEDKGSRASIMSSLAQYLPNSVEIYQNALTTISVIEDDIASADVLSAIAPHLAKEAREAAYMLEDAASYSRVLRSVAPHLPDSMELYREALEMVRLTWYDDFGRVRELSALAPHLPQEVLEAVHEIEDDAGRAKVLSALAPHLPGEVWEAVPMLNDESSRAKVLSALAPHLTQEVWEAVPTIKNDSSRTLLLSALAHPMLLICNQNATFAVMWHERLMLSATYPRATLLNDLEALMPFTLGLTCTSFTGTILPHQKIAFTSTQRAQLIALMNHLDLATPLLRTQFLENIGAAPFRNELHFDVPQRTFVQQLLSVLADAGNAPDGKTYLTKLLRYLHDVEWIGHVDRRDFVKDLLNVSNTSANHAQQRLAQGIFEAVQTVCLWWK